MPSVSTRYLPNYESLAPPPAEPLLDDGTANARLATVPGRDRSASRRWIGVTGDESRSRGDLRTGVSFISTSSDDGNGNGDDIFKDGRAQNARPNKNKQRVNKAQYPVHIEREIAFQGQGNIAPRCVKTRPRGNRLQRPRDLRNDGLENIHVASSLA